MVIVYVVTRLSDGMRYVGITTKSLGARWANHLSNSKARKGALSRAIDDDDRNGFAIDIVEDGVEVAELSERERLWIKRLGTLAPFGFNGNSGGARGPLGLTPKRGRAVAVADIHGVTLTTAARWIKERSADDYGRRTQAHGLAKTRAWAKWRVMHSDGGVVKDWESLTTFAVFFNPIHASGHQLRRINKSEPWGPWNCYSPISTAKR